MLNVFLRTCGAGLLALVLVPCQAQDDAPQTLLVSIDNSLSATLASLDESVRIFISEWDSTTAACEAVHGTFLGNLKSPCRAVRAAIRRGTIARFKLDCIETGRSAVALTSERASEQYPDFTRAALPGQADTRALQDIFMRFESRLFSLCDLEFDPDAFPAFASLYRQSPAMPRTSDFSTFGSSDSMAWWSYNQDPASYSSGIDSSGFGAPGGRPSLPVIQGD